LSLEAIERVVRKLADEKLVVTDDREKGKVGGDAIVDVAHEALIRGWKRLRVWLDEDRQNLRQQRWIEDRAIEWQRSEKVKEFLLSGKQLKEARKFQQQQVDRFPLPELAEQLLKVSKHQQKKSWAFVAAVYMAIPVSVSIVLGGFAIRLWYLETKWAVLRQCEKEQTKDGQCAGRIGALRALIDANVSLQAINLSKSNLSKSILIGADLRKSNLSNAELRNAYLDKTELFDANLSNSLLSNASLILSNLQNANLENANLEGVNLSRANLSRASLRGANLSRAYITLATLYSTSLTFANLTFANFSNADLIRADLSNANLQNANLQNANLQNANLQNANLEGVNLSNAKLGNANLMLLATSTLGSLKTACNLKQAKMSKELYEQINKTPNPKAKPSCNKWNNSP